MGMFLALSGVIGKTQNEVANSLANYAKAAGGGLQQQNLEINDKHRCVILEQNNNTTIFYPFLFMEWEKASAFISEELKAPVFALHIHDGDFWMYTLYYNGEEVDQFIPIPNYWDDDMSEAEIENLKGNAGLVAGFVPGLDPASIERYLVRWNFEEGDKKAYEDDQYYNIDWQLLDFMKKLGLPYPLGPKGEALGQVYKLLTQLIITH